MVVIVIVGSMAVVCRIGPIVAVVWLWGIVSVVLVPPWWVLVGCDCSRFSGAVCVSITMRVSGGGCKGG